MNTAARRSVRSVAPELWDAWEREWGDVEASVSTVHEATGLVVNVLAFAPGRDRFCRLVTHGLSHLPGRDQLPHGVELLLTAEASFGGVELERAMEHLLAVGAHVVEHAMVPIEPLLIAPSDLSPYGPSAVLLDEPLWEAEEVSVLRADGVHVRLVWAIPIHPAEHDLIAAADSAVEAVGLLAETMETTWADLDRPPAPASWLRR